MRQIAIPACLALADHEEAQPSHFYQIAASYSEHQTVQLAMADDGIAISYQWGVLRRKMTGPEQTDVKKPETHI